MPILDELQAILRRPLQRKSGERGVQFCRRLARQIDLIHEDKWRALSPAAVNWVNDFLGTDSINANVPARKRKPLPLLEGLPRPPGRKANARSNVKKVSKTKVSRTARHTRRV